MECTKNNIYDWLLTLFQNRTYLNIHNFEPSFSKGLLITYQVPLVMKSGISRRFNTNVVSVRLVIEYPMDKETGFLMKIKVRLITFFVQNDPFLQDDINTLLNICPNTMF